MREGGLGFLGRRPSLIPLPTSASLLKQLLQTSTPQPEALAWAKRLEVRGGGSAVRQMVGWHMGLLLRKEKQIPLVLLLIRSEVRLIWVGHPDWLVRDKKDGEKQER